MVYKNILLIDDDEDDREIFITALQSLELGTHCIAMSNAVDALQKLTDQILTPDVIFLDLNMPILNGEQFLMQVKNTFQVKNIPIIIFSTSSHAATIKKMKDLGAADFITKPDRYDKLVHILKALLS